MGERELSADEIALLQWYREVCRRVGGDNMIITERLLINRANGWVDGIVNVGIRAPNFTAWRAEARRITGGRIEAKDMLEDLVTGELRGELMLRARIAIGKPVA